MEAIASGHRVVKEVCDKVNGGKVPYPKMLKKKLNNWAGKGYLQSGDIERRQKIDGHRGVPGKFFRWELPHGYHAVFAVYKDIAWIIWIGPFDEYDRKFY